MTPGERRSTGASPLLEAEQGRKCEVEGAVEMVVLTGSNRCVSASAATAYALARPKLQGCLRDPQGRRARSLEVPAMGRYRGFSSGVIRQRPSVEQMAVEICRTLQGRRATFPAANVWRITRTKRHVIFQNNEAVEVLSYAPESWVEDVQLKETGEEDYMEDASREDNCGAKFCRWTGELWGLFLGRPIVGAKGRLLSNNVEGRIVMQGFLWKLARDCSSLEDARDFHLWRRRQFFLVKQPNELVLMYISEQENGALCKASLLASRENSRRHVSSPTESSGRSPSPSGSLSRTGSPASSRPSSSSPRLFSTTPTTPRSPPRSPRPQFFAPGVCRKADMEELEPIDLLPYDECQRMMDMVTYDVALNITREPAEYSRALPRTLFAFRVSDLTRPESVEVEEDTRSQENTAKPRQPQLILAGSRGQARKRWLEAIKGWQAITDEY